jgi:hypothetical protein
MADIERKISVAAKMPVLLRDTSGVPVTGVVFGGVTVKYRKFGQTSFTTKTISGSDWFEVGDGWYDVLFSASELDTVEDFNYIVQEASSVQWNGFAVIVPETRSEIKTKTDTIDSNIDDLQLDVAQLLVDTSDLLELNQFKVDEYQEYTYDGQGRVSTVTLKIGSDVAPTSTWLISFTYNLDNSVDKMSAVKQ